MRLSGTHRKKFQGPGVCAWAVRCIEQESEAFMNPRTKSTVTKSKTMMNRWCSLRFAQATSLGVFVAMPTQAAFADWQEQEKVVAGGIAGGDLFGNSVDLSDDTIFVGAKQRSNGDGAVFVRAINASGSSSFTEIELPAGQDNGGSLFGNFVLEHNGTLFVGAHRKDAPGAGEEPPILNAGAVHVYKQNLAGTWQWSQTLVASDPSKADQFGTSFATDGQTLVVSAPRRDSNALVDSGAAYVFQRSASGEWIQSQIIEAPLGMEGDLFGQSLGIANGRMLIGAHLADGQAASDGRVFAYLPSAASTSWELSQTLQAPSPAPDAQFGFSLDLHGDVAAVGAPTQIVNGVASGAVHLFTFSSGSWISQDTLVPASPAADAEFGSELDLSEDQSTLVVGAPVDSSATLFAGAIHVFSNPGSGWSEQQKLVSSTAKFFDELGGSFRIRDNKLLVGVRNDDTAGPQAGAAYLFTSGQGEVPAPAPLGSLLSLSLIGGGLFSLRRRYRAFEK